MISLCAFSMVSGSARSTSAQDADADADVPLGYHVEHRINVGLTIAGSILLGVPYLLGLPAAVNQDSGWLAVPVVGPWLAYTQPVGQCDAGVEPDIGCLVAVKYLLLPLDGVLQASGALLMIIGLTSTKEVVVPDRSSHLLLVPTFSVLGSGPDVPSHTSARVVRGLSLSGVF